MATQKKSTKGDGAKALWAVESLISGKIDYATLGPTRKWVKSEYMRTTYYTESDYGIRWTVRKVTVSLA